MARVTVEDCLKNVENRFALVILASRRTKQILKGSKPMIERPKNKETIIALREIADSKVRIKNRIHTGPPVHGDDER